MQYRALVPCVVAVILLSACDYWPEQLKPLAASISQEVSGETTAWLVGGNVVVIDVAHSPLYRQNMEELADVATGIAGQAVEFADVALESVSVTFHEGDVSEEAGTMREFIFLVKDDKPVLQPLLRDNATGPLTLAEIRPLFIEMGEPMSEEREQCVLREVQERARNAGDPETLDPATVEFLPEKDWHRLDRFGKRLILAQVIVTRSAFVCIRQDK